MIQVLSYNLFLHNSIILLESLFFLFYFCFTSIVTLHFNNYFLFIQFFIIPKNQLFYLRADKNFRKFSFNFPILFSKEHLKPSFFNNFFFFCFFYIFLLDLELFPDFLLAFCFSINVYLYSI